MFCIARDRGRISGNSPAVWSLQLAREVLGRHLWRRDVALNRLLHQHDLRDQLWWDLGSLEGIKNLDDVDNVCWIEFSAEVLPQQLVNVAELDVTGTQKHFHHHCNILQVGG